MIFKRAVAKLRAQDWTAIGIELAIVVLGVFIGMWVTNWNQKRQSENETRRTLVQLEPELRQLQDFSAGARTYYAITGRYTKTALAGWRRDPAVNDAQFVIAAYQASQVYGFNNDGASWALVFGANDLRDIPDPEIRQSLTRLMTFDYGTINIGAVQTRYRDRVRETIPDSIQQEIRKQCGDIIPNAGGVVILRATCPLGIEPAVAAATAADLRHDTELPRLLSQHRSAVATYLTNLALYDRQEQILAKRIQLLDR